MNDQLIMIIIFNLSMMAIAYRWVKKGRKEEQENINSVRTIIKEQLKEWEEEVKENNYENYDKAKRSLSDSNIPRFYKVERELKVFIKWQNQENKKKTDQSKNSGGTSTWLPNNLAMDDYYKDEEMAIQKKKKDNGAPMI